MSSDVVAAEGTNLPQNTLQPDAYALFLQGRYGAAAERYEQFVETEPGQPDRYWYLGLSLLLQGQEADAQTAWFMGMADAEPEQLTSLTIDLVAVLQKEADRLTTKEDFQAAWLIRRHLREIDPENLRNLLLILQLSVALGTYTGEDLAELGVIDALQAAAPGVLEEDLVLATLQAVLELDPLHPDVIALIEASQSQVSDPAVLVELLKPVMVKVGYGLSQHPTAINLAELCLRLVPDSMDMLGHLATFYQRSGRHNESIAMAKRYRDLAASLPTRVFGNSILIRHLMIAGGWWEEVYEILQQFETLLQELIETQYPLSLEASGSLFTSTACLPYLRDEARQNRWLHNELAKLCQANLQRHAIDHVQRQYYLVPQTPKALDPQRPLRIGYLSAYLKRHSVGWLARWLFQHHDREKFHISAYLLNIPEQDAHVHHWFIDHVHEAHHLGTNYFEIADKIYADKIDVLIDLDSITLDITSEVMCLKPAPVQATWLGWDASGIPTIDYYIADPYVLPDCADEYYAEKIWRLPQTYIAVDGFELGVPTLRRDQLGVPSDAVVFLSGQKGHKRHPDTVRLQMKIIKEVPNSYFFVKGIADEKVIKQFFTQIAEEEGVEVDRLRFLPEVPMESIHRANLQIADVVLDTFPYNGATTTMETLWAGVPMVTRVGDQFSSRNSYGMMINAGITEGIAWTDEEYVEWGARLGKDAALRQLVSWKLRSARQTAPLWNARQFTREMEKAYTQMWERYMEGC